VKRHSVRPKMYMPHLVGHRAESGSVSRILCRWTAVIIYLRRVLPHAFSGLPENLDGPPCAPKCVFPYVTLLQAGFGQPTCHHDAGALLPHHFTLAAPRPAETCSMAGPAGCNRTITMRAAV
jgi:hypothetical protein